MGYELLMGLALLSRGLLRATGDLKVWRYIQATTLLVVVASIYSAFDAFSVQDRLQPALWCGEDWGMVLIIAFVTSWRVAFLAGIGFKTHADKADSMIARRCVALITTSEA
jgi:Na+-driven multidrug efflux pump